MNPLFQLAFNEYLKETYPNIKENGIIKHLKRLEKYYKIIEKENGNNSTK